MSSLTTDMVHINPAGLIGHELVEMWKADLDSCYDWDGSCDYMELDHTFEQIEYDMASMERDADILSVFAEEAGRFT